MRGRGRGLAGWGLIANYITSCVCLYSVTVCGRERRGVDAMGKCKTGDGERWDGGVVM